MTSNSYSKDLEHLLSSVSHESASSIDVGENGKSFRFLKVVHKDQGSIPNYWLVYKIIWLAVATFGGILTTIAVGRITNCFCGECFLYGRVRFTLNGNFTLGSQLAVSTYDCSFVEYVPMITVCCAVLIAVMYIQCKNMHPDKKSHKRNPSWMLVVPTVPLVFIMFILALITLVKFSNGTSFFCKHAMTKANDLGMDFESCYDVYGQAQKAYRRWSNAECSYYQRAHSYDACDDEDVFHTNIIIATLGASIHLLGWTFTLFVLLARIGTHADFDVKRLVIAPTEKPPTPTPGYQTDCRRRNQQGSAVVKVKSPKTDDGSLKLMKFETGSSDTVFDSDFVPYYQMRETEI